MKIAISGKSGAGKTLLVAMLSKILAESGHFVTAIDTDFTNLPILNSSQQIMSVVKDICQVLLSASNKLPDTN